MPAPALHLEGTARFGAATLFGPLSLTIPSNFTEQRTNRATDPVGRSFVDPNQQLVLKAALLIAGLDGGATFNGTIRASDGLPLPGRLSLMAQDDLLMPWLDALENAVLGARLRGQEPDRVHAHAVLDQLGLSEHAAKRPAELSGGQRQRVALARTLIEDRPVVLLDEPFSALDAGTRARMQDLAADHLGGRTVLMVTHDPELLRTQAALLTRLRPAS